MQPNRRNSNDMDMSGRSTGSASSMNSFMMMEQQQRFPPGSPYNPNFPQQSPQQHQRFFQMQMQQHQMQMQMRPQLPPQQQQQQQQQQQRPVFIPQQQQAKMQQQQQQRRNSLASVGSNQSTQSRPVMPPPPQTITKTPAASPPVAAAAAPPAAAAAAVPKPAPKPKSKPRYTHPPPPSMEEAGKLLKHCDWVDKTLWASRQLFGGNSLNLFLGSTAQVQKVKKNRARHFSKAAKASGDEKKRPAADEEALKKEIMNARTAKRMKTEMDTGLQFCEVLHETIRSILKEMNPLFEPPPSLNKDLPDPNISRAVRPRLVVAAAAPKPPPPPKLPAITTASPGNPIGSTLRRHRKKKLPASKEPPLNLSEYDESTKKKYPKKEQLHRITQVTRFRALRRDDYVAARVSSRDLWILAKVLKDFDGFNMDPAAFLKLTEARRDQVFRDKVLLKDVEEKQEGTSVQVARSLVLPLPRSFSEAAEWAQRTKKGARVYAMYPNTTSLYSATVVDNTTYCRDDDDIIVVEFDGDEPDATGAVPKCHIPARFVTIIPRELPAAQPPKLKQRKSLDSTASAGSSSSVRQSAAAAMLNDPLNGMDMLDDMNFDDALPGLDGFDDLDFDLLGG